MSVLRARFDAMISRYVSNINYDHFPEVILEIETVAKVAARVGVRRFICISHLSSATTKSTSISMDICKGS